MNAPDFDPCEMALEDGLNAIVACFQHTVLVAKLVAERI